MRPIMVVKRRYLGYFTNQLVNLVAGGLCSMPPLGSTRSTGPLTGPSAAIYGDAWNGRGTDFVINKEPCRLT